jgi:hypothetical protein
MSRFEEYLEAVTGPVAIATHSKKESLGQRVKDFLNSKIGTLKGWRITVVDEAGINPPVVHNFDAKALRDMKIGDVAIPQEEMNLMKAGDVIKPYMVTKIDTDQRVITIKKDYRSTMFHAKDLKIGKK